jgi:drug/metabolite transporter (DMT)-like permease
LEIRPWTGGRKKAFGLAFLAGVFLALHFFSWIASLKLTTVANSAMLVSTSPVFVGVGSAVLLRERPGVRTWAGLLVAVLGAIVIAWSKDTASGVSAGRLSGDLLAVLGAVMAAGYLLCGRKVGGTWSTRTYLFWVYFPAFLTLLMIALISGVPLFGWDAGVYILLFCIALGPQAIGHSSLNWALRFFPATTVSLVTLAEPVGAAILAWIFLHEQPGLQQFIGGLILLSGLYWAGRTRRASSSAIKADTA